MKVKNVFYPSCNCDLFCYFCFFQTLCLILVFFVWVECVLVGERKKKRKRKKTKTEQAVEGKGGVKMM
jgi:hypothetical protein